MAVVPLRSRLPLLHSARLGDENPARQEYVRRFGCIVNSNGGPCLFRGALDVRKNTTEVPADGIAHIVV